jgi:hypothetical protein
MSNIFALLKEKLSNPQESTIILAYIDGYRDVEQTFSDPKVAEAYSLGRRDAGFVDPDINGQYHCHKYDLTPQAINATFEILYYPEEIGELYDNIAYYLGLSKEQLQSWFTILDNSTMHDIAAAYNYRHQGIGFQVDEKRPGSYSMSYVTFMKLVSAYVKRQGLIEKQSHEKNKLSFKRKSDETELINRTKPRYIYRDNGWIQEANINLSEICNDLKKFKL